MKEDDRNNNIARTMTALKNGPAYYTDSRVWEASTTKTQWSPDEFSLKWQKLSED